MSTGRKYDTGKPQMRLVPPRALRETAEVLTFGATKYAPDNWRKLDDLQNRYLDAALRHINEFQMGQRTDPESGRHVLAHSICDLMFVLEDILMTEAGQPAGTASAEPRTLLQEETGMNARMRDYVLKNSELLED
jgi:hypothetical protein